MGLALKPQLQAPPMSKRQSLSISKTPSNPGSLMARVHTRQEDGQKPVYLHSMMQISDTFLCPDTKYMPFPLCILNCVEL